jgi:hypothetical protein
MMDHSGMMDQCMEMMSNMMGGNNMMDGMMGSSFSVLPIVATLLLIWLISLATLGGLGFWAVRRFAR